MFGLRLHVMRMLGFATESLATEVRNSEVRREDAARNARLGPQEGAIARGQQFAAEVQERALRVNRS